MDPAPGFQWVNPESYALTRPPHKRGRNEPSSFNLLGRNHRKSSNFGNVSTAHNFQNAVPIFKNLRAARTRMESISLERYRATAHN